MDNPVIVIVDASPRWPYGDTIRNQDAEWEEKQNGSDPRAIAQSYVLRR